MFTLIFVILMFMVFGKLLVFAIKAAWGITKIIWTIVVLPIAVNRTGGMWTDLYSSSGIGNYWYCIAVLHEKSIIL